MIDVPVRPSTHKSITRQASVKASKNQIFLFSNFVLINEENENCVLNMYTTANFKYLQLLLNTLIFLCFCYTLLLTSMVHDPITR